MFACMHMPMSASLHGILLPMYAGHTHSEDDSTISSRATSAAQNSAATTGSAKATTKNLNLDECSIGHEKVRPQESYCMPDTNSCHAAQRLS